MNDSGRLDYGTGGLDIYAREILENFHREQVTSMHGVYSNSTRFNLFPSHNCASRLFETCSGVLYDRWINEIHRCHCS